MKTYHVLRLITLTVFPLYSVRNDCRKSQNAKIFADFSMVNNRNPTLTGMHHKLPMYKTFVCKLMCFKGGKGQNQFLLVITLPWHVRRHN